MEKDQKKIKVLKGKVVSTKMKDTVVVEVDRYVKYPIYEKYHTVTKRYKVHDPENTVKVGETVEIISCKPISKHKKFLIKK